VDSDCLLVFRRSRGKGMRNEIFFAAARASNDRLLVPVRQKLLLTAAGGKSQPH